MIPKVKQGQLINRHYSFPLATAMRADGSGLWGFPEAEVKITGASVHITNWWWHDEEPYDTAELCVDFECPNHLIGLLPYTDHQMEDEVRQMILSDDELAKLIDAISWSEQGMQGHDFMSFDANVAPGYENMEPDSWDMQTI
jgi:hypothetical protein